MKNKSMESQMATKRNVSYWHVLKTLIKSEFKVFLNKAADVLIDTGLWILVSVFVSGYIITGHGMPANYLLIAISGLVASAGLMQAYSGIFNLVSDISGDRTISYSLTLPMPSWLVVLNMIVSLSLSAMFCSSIALPVALGLLAYRGELALVAPFKLLIAFVLGNIFWATFSIFMTSITDGPFQIRKVWMRIMFPMWFLGGYGFSWMALSKIAPTFAYFALANPFLYVFESIRCAMLGQEGYLPFWISSGLLFMFIVMFALISIRNLRRRLDFV